MLIKEGLMLAQGFSEVVGSELRHIFDISLVASPFEISRVV